MEAIVYPYLAVETDFVDIYNRKEVIVDFYLIQDLRPFPDCVGSGSETHKRMQKELNNLK